MLSVLTLRNEKSGDHYDILNKKTHLVARAGFNGDLNIPDMSVSRCHAEMFFIKEAISNTVKLFLKLVDKQSKFGTFLNSGIDLNKRIESNCPIILKLNDRIRFGIMDSIWTVVKYPIVVCPSTLKVADKDILRKTLAKIEGQITCDWSKQCTHLCMNSIIVTEKVLLCLASVKSIVSIKYFIDLCEALSPGSLTELPYCIDYQPKLVENVLNPNSVSLDLDHKRISLFSGKTFICSTEEQLNRISKLVKIANGEIINYFENIVSDNDILYGQEFILMHQDSHNTKKNDEYQLILDKLIEMNKRPIPENDIGLAIIFSSTEKHCNPNFNVSLVNLQSQSNETNLQTSVILAPETQVVSVDKSEICSNNVIPNSLSQFQGLKRSLDVVMDSEETVMSKQRELFYNDVEEYHHSELIKAKDLKPFTRVIESTQCSNNDHTFKSVEYEKTVTNETLTNDGSCLTTVPSSQDISNENIYLSCVQPIIEENKTIKNNFHLEIVNNTEASIAKRKLSSSSFINNDVDPFNYINIDKIEIHPKKKLKLDVNESILAMTSSNESEQSKPLDPTTYCAKNQGSIMNLLAKAKGVGQFIDASKLPDKSYVNENEDTENDDLLNSVIIETVSMVISKPTQTQNIEGSHSNLRNFKKFKRKGPIMKIPYIVSMELDEFY